MKFPSAFDLGIVSAKKGKTLMDNPFNKEDGLKYQWWRDGFEAATGEKYVTDDGVKMCNKPIYEKCAELVE